MEYRKLHIPELELRPFLALDAASVQLGDGQGHLVTDVLVEDPHEDNREGGEGKIVEKNVCIIEEVRAVEAVVQLIPEEGKGPDNRLSQRVSGWVSAMKRESSGSPVSLSHSEG
jgi:hypothetical protein